MNRFFMFLWALGSLTVLCQWYVFVSVRKFLFQAYAPVTRSVAYSVLTLLALLNLIGIELSMESRWFGVAADVQRVSAVVFFSYLGLIFVLCISFVFLKAVDQIVRVAQLLPGITSKLAGSSHVAGSEAGCVTASRSTKIKDLRNIGCRKSSPENDLTSTGRIRPLPITDYQGNCTNPVPTFLSRRTFLKWGTVTGIITGAGVVGKGIAGAYQRPVTEQLEVFHSGLAGLSRPLKLIHVTDFHLGLFYGTRELEDLVETLNSIDGDAVVLTGDIYHSPLSQVELSTPVLKKLRPRRMGNLAVLGNHDFYAGVSRSVASLEGASIRLLRNEWITFRQGNVNLHIGGIDDPVANWLWGEQFPAFTSFMEMCPDSPGLKILLSHRPAIFPQASRSGIDLVLSGHTHGGQIIIPGISERKGYSLAAIVSPFTHGWYRTATSSMYLNRGIGLTFVPWRINCPPEIAVLHLSGTKAKG